MGTDTTETVDRIAMALGGGLVFVGVAVMGFINVIAGAPHLPVEEEGAIVATPVVAPELRAGLIAAGLGVWFVYALYTLATPPADGGRDAPAAPTDD